MIPLISLGQDTIKQTSNKCQFSIQAGGFYKNFFGQKYVEPTTYNVGDQFEEHQFERFTKVPTYGFSIGFLFQYIFNKHWRITSGLLYCLRTDIYENNRDTIIKYEYNASLRNIHNVLKYDYTNNNLELPILINYKYRKTNFCAGVKLSLLSYKIARYTYLIDQFPQNPEWTVSDKTIKGFEMPLMIFPTLQISYDTRINNIGTNPFIKFEYLINKQKSYYIQFGINLPIKSMNSNKSNL